MNWWSNLWYSVPYLCRLPSYGFGRKSAYNLHSLRWDLQTRCTINLMSTFKAAVDVYISYKFGGLLYSYFAVNTAEHCVQLQQASVSTRVNSSTFTRGQQFCASILLARGRHCYAGWAIRKVLPRISSSQINWTVWRTLSRIVPSRWDENGYLAPGGFCRYIIYSSLLNGTNHWN